MSDSTSKLSPATAAPTLPATQERLGRLDVAPILEGATEVFDLESDNDRERWFFTRASQFVRISGLDQERCFVYDADTAFEILSDQIDDQTRERYFGPAATPPSL